MKKIIVCLTAAVCLVCFASCGMTSERGEAAPSPSVSMTPDLGSGYVGDTDGIIEPEDNVPVEDGTENDSGTVTPNVPTAR